MKIFIVLLLVLLSSMPGLCQTGTVRGTISSEGKNLQFASVQIEGTSMGGTADANGKYYIENVPPGTYTVAASFIGFVNVTREITIQEGQLEPQLDFNLPEFTYELDQVVVTGTRTAKRQTESPVVVNVIDNQGLTNVQACNLSEGLKFQPGLRVETNCQTCNYTQLRMNGLGGGYSQILINGRPIFSPLTGLYGMEQIPTNMIERIEVVRGGGSALYGSSAIGGTVNVITRIPTRNGYNIGYTYQNINGTAYDHILSGNGTIVSGTGNSGASFFLNNRRRQLYDHNGDNFSELPELKNNSFGTNLFFRPKENQKLEMNLSSINEYRYGGEMVDKAPHLTQQSEERTHNVLIGNIDYQINFNNSNSSLIAYAAAQNTHRDHYTGIFPDDSVEIVNHLRNPPYGFSRNSTYQGGVQFNHLVSSFLGGNNVLTIGGEYINDDIQDVIEAYNYEVDQVTKNLGAFFQSDWEITQKLSLLAGLRVDGHNFVDGVIGSPRFSFLYRPISTMQLRMSWGTGFRAPQAFDTDLHIAFAGGGISRISLNPDLKEERSNSFSGSINYDKPTEHFIVGFSLEGFHTNLVDAFYLHPLGEDEFGQRYEKRNGDGATVQGGTLELRGNYDGKYQFEAGYTLQTSLYNQPVQYIEGLEGKREFLRTPNQYGYTTLTLNPHPKFNTTFNLIYTGTMELAHFAGAPEQQVDEFKTSPTFTEFSFRTSYTFGLGNSKTGLEFFGGIRNILNAYQDDFDSGKNRDSNYIYGPSLPRSFFAGFKIKSL